MSLSPPVAGLALQMHGHHENGISEHPSGDMLQWIPQIQPGYTYSQRGLRLTFHVDVWINSQLALTYANSQQIWRRNNSTESGSDPSLLFPAPILPFKSCGAPNAPSSCSTQLLSKELWFFPLFTLLLQTEGKI